MQYGPLSIGINATPMQWYTGGIADPFFCSPAALDHGVAIVGFGKEGINIFKTYIYTETKFSRKFRFRFDFGSILVRFWFVFGSFLVRLFVFCSFVRFEVRFEIRF